MSLFAFPRETQFLLWVSRAHRVARKPVLALDSLENEFPYRFRGTERGDMWIIPDKKFIFDLLLWLALFGTQFILVTGRAFAQIRIAADNSIQAVKSPANSFKVKKTVKFTLSQATEVFVRYDLGQSHGSCTDHAVGGLGFSLMEWRSAGIRYLF
jgi:hypothetical protein